MRFRFGAGGLSTIPKYMFIIHTRKTKVKSEFIQNRGRRPVLCYNITPCDRGDLRWRKASRSWGHRRTIVEFHTKSTRSIAKKKFLEDGYERHSSNTFSTLSDPRNRRTRGGHCSGVLGQPRPLQRGLASSVIYTPTPSVAYTSSTL